MIKFISELNTFFSIFQPRILIIILADPRPSSPLACVNVNAVDLMLLVKLEKLVDFYLNLFLFAQHLRKSKLCIQSK